MSHEDYAALLEPPIDLEPPSQLQNVSNAVTQVWLITQGGSGQQMIPEDERVS